MQEQRSQQQQAPQSDAEQVLPPQEGEDWALQSDLDEKKRQEQMLEEILWNDEAEEGGKEGGGGDGTSLSTPRQDSLLSHLSVVRINRVSALRELQKRRCIPSFRSISPYPFPYLNAAAAASAAGQGEKRGRGGFSASSERVAGGLPTAASFPSASGRVVSVEWESTARERRHVRVADSTATAGPCRREGAYAATREEVAAGARAAAGGGSQRNRRRTREAAGKREEEHAAAESGEAEEHGGRRGRGRSLRGEHGKGLLTRLSFFRASKAATAAAAATTWFAALCAGGSLRAPASTAAPKKAEPVAAAARAAQTAAAEADIGTARQREHRRRTGRGGRSCGETWSAGGSGSSSSSARRDNSRSQGSHSNYDSGRVSSIGRERTRGHRSTRGEKTQEEDSSGQRHSESSDEREHTKQNTAVAAGLSRDFSRSRSSEGTSIKRPLRDEDIQRQQQIMESAAIVKQQQQGERGRREEQLVVRQRQQQQRIAGQIETLSEAKKTQKEEDEDEGDYERREVQQQQHIAEKKDALERREGGDSRCAAGKAPPSASPATHKVSQREVPSFGSEESQTAADSRRKREAFVLHSAVRQCVMVWPRHKVYCGSVFASCVRHGCGFTLYGSSDHFELTANAAVVAAADAAASAAAAAGAAAAAAACASGSAVAGRALSAAAAARAEVLRRAALARGSSRMLGSGSWTAEKLLTGMAGIKRLPRLYVHRVPDVETPHDSSRCWQQQSRHLQPYAEGASDADSDAVAAAAAERERIFAVARLTAEETEGGRTEAREEDAAERGETAAAGNREATGGCETQAAAKRVWQREAAAAGEDGRHETAEEADSSGGRGEEIEGDREEAAGATVRVEVAGAAGEEIATTVGKATRCQRSNQEEVDWEEAAATTAARTPAAAGGKGRTSAAAAEAADGVPVEKSSCPSPPQMSASCGTTTAAAAAAAARPCCCTHSLGASTLQQQNISEEESHKKDDQGHFSFTSFPSGVASSSSALGFSSSSKSSSSRGRASPAADTGAAAVAEGADVTTATTIGHAAAATAAPAAANAAGPAAGNVASHAAWTVATPAAGNAAAPVAADAVGPAAGTAAAAALRCVASRRLQEETESLAAADTRDDEVGHPAKSAEPEDGESDEAAAGGEVMLARGLSGREEENTLVCGGACGCWSLGKRVGWGVAVRGSGRALVKYEGLWRDDYKEGWGIQTLSHCVRYAGSFRNGLQHGKSLLLYPTGVLFAAEWRCGVLVEQQLLFATYSQPPQRRQNAAPTNPRQQHAAVAATAAGAVAVAPTAAGAGGAAPTAAGVAVAADDACVSYRFGGEATAEVQDKLHVQQQGQQLLQTAGSRAVSGEEAALGERMTRPGGREEAEVAEKITAADGRETRAAEGTKIAACTRRLAGDTGAAEDDNEERRGQAGGTGVARKNPIGTSGRGEEGNADFRGTARIAAAVADEASTETEKERREIAEKRASRQQSSSSRSSTDRKVSLDMGRGSSAGGCQRPESCSRIRCFARRSKDKVAPRSQSSGARALSEGAGEIGGSSGRAAAAAYGSGCSLAAPGSQEKTAASEAPEKDRAAAPPAARGAKTAGKSRSAVLIRGKAREEQSHGDAEGQPRDEERLRQQYEAVRALSSASACDQWDEQQTQHLLMWAATPQRLRVLLQQQAVDGAALLSATEEDLKEMNIERWEDRRMLLLLVGLLLKLQHRQKQRLRYSSRHLQKHALLLSVVGIRAAELQLEARIGEGGYSRVYRARWKYTRSLELHQLQRHYDQQRQIQQQVLHQQTQLLQQQHELRRGLLQTQNSVQQQFLQQTRDSPLLRQQQISRPQRQDCQQQQTTQQQTTQQQHFPASFNVPLEEPQLREGARQYNAKNAASTAAVLSSLASIAPAAAAVNFSAAARYGAAAGLNVTGPVGSVAGGVSSHGGDGRPRAEKVFSHGWRSRFGLCHGSRQKTPKRLQSAAARQQQEQQQEQQHGACPPASDSPTSAASCHVAAAGQPASGGQPGPPVKPQTLPQAWHGVAEAAGAIDSLGDAQALRDNIKNLIHNANEETAPEARNAAFTMGFPHLTGVHDHTSRLATGIRKAVADSLEEDEAMEAAADDAAETTCQRRAASINWRPSAAWDDTPEGRPNLRGAADVRGPAADARRAAADARGIAFDARGGSADTRGEETDTREGDDADTRRRVTDAHEGDADWEDKWRRNAPDGGSSLTWKEAAEGRGAGHWGSDIMKFGETGKSVLLRQWQGRVPAEWRSNRSSSRSLWSSMLRSRRRRSSSRRRGRVGEAEGEVLVAVKVFRQRQQKALQRSFYSELAVLSRLAHPNITMLLGAVSAPIYGLVTEYVPCGSLFDLLHASHQQQQDWAGSPQQQRQERQGVDLSLMQIVRLARDICLGMAYLHQQGVLHCDLKSPNVLLTAKGEVKLCDFGLATIVETLHEAPVNDFQANEGWGAEPPRKSPSNNRRRDQEKAETECDDAKEKKERSNSRDNGSKDCNSRDCSRTDCSRRDCSSRHCSSRDCISRDCSSRDCSSKDCNSRDCSRKDCSRSDCSGKHCIGSRHCSSSAPERVGRGSDSGSSASRRRGRQGKRNTKRGTEEEDSEVFGRQQDVARIPAAGTSRRRCEKYTNSTPRGYSRRSSKARSGSRTCSSRARSGSNNCSGMEEETQENWCEVGSSGCSFHRPSHATSSSRLLPAEKISETLHARSREEGNSTSVGMTPGECEADKEVECAKLAKEREEIFTVVATDDRNKETASDPSLRKKHFTYIPVHYAETPEENRLQPQRQQQQAERQQHQEMQQHQGMQQHQQEEPRRPGQGEVGSVESSGRARRMNKQESERSSGVFPERSSSQRMSPRRTGIVGEPGGVKLEPAHLGCVGTHHWMAPEVLRGEAFTTAADVYSFGVILWEILHRKIPFQNMTSPAHLIIAIGYGGAQLDVSRAPPPLRYILSRCLDHNPERRPSFSWCAEQLHALYTANVLDVEVNLSMLLGLGQ